MDRPYYEQYEETQELVFWARAAFFIGAAGVAVGCYLMFRDPTVPRSMAWSFLALTAVMFWAFWAFARLTIRIGGGRIEIRYGPVGPTVDLEDIEWIASEPITFRRYGGIGIRVGAGAVCYNTRFGDGIRMHVRGRKRDWVFTTKDPAEVARALGMELLPAPPA
jgi:hypothetical protein